MKFYEDNDCRFRCTIEDFGLGTHPATGRELLKIKAILMISKLHMTFWSIGTDALRIARQLKVGEQYLFCARYKPLSLEGNNFAGVITNRNQRTIVIHDCSLLSTPKIEPQNNNSLEKIIEREIDKSQ